MRRILKLIVLLLVVACVGAAVAGEMTISRSNPPERYSGTILSAEADPILKRACFDCHSNETRYPWYSYLPGASLVLAEHVRDGRDELNFSLWDKMDAKRKAKKLHEIAEEVDEGKMPTWDYQMLHSEAKLSAADVAIIKNAAR